MTCGVVLSDVPLSRRLSYPNTSNIVCLCEDLRPLRYCGWPTTSRLSVALLANPSHVVSGDCPPSQVEHTSAAVSSDSLHRARPSVDYLAQDPFACDTEEGPGVEETHAIAAPGSATLAPSQVRAVYEGVSLCVTPSPLILRAATASKANARTVAFAFVGFGNTGIEASDQDFENGHEGYFGGYMWTSHEAQAAEDNLTEEPNFGGLHAILSAITNVASSQISEGFEGGETLAGAEAEVNAASAWALLAGGLSLLHGPLPAM